jgi:hypothetical protein
MCAPAPAAHAAARSMAAADLRVQRQAPAGVQQQADAPAVQPGAWVEVRVGPGQWLIGQAGGVACVGPAQRGHQQRGIRHAACDGPGHTAQIGRLDGHPAGAGLEAHHAAPGGRQADGAADVGAHVQRAIARGSGGCGAGTAAAGVLAQVPGVAGQRVEAAQARRQHAVVGHRGLAQQHRPVFAQAGGRWRVGAGRLQLGGRGAQRQRQAARGDVLLQRDGHAVQWSHRLVAQPARFGGASRLQCRVGIQRPGGLQVRLPAGDVGQHIVHHRQRRQLAKPEGVHQLRGAQLVQVAHAWRAAGVRPCPGSGAGSPWPCLAPACGTAVSSPGSDPARPAPDATRPRNRSGRDGAGSDPGHRTRTRHRCG